MAKQMGKIPIESPFTANLHQLAVTYPAIHELDQDLSGAERRKLEFLDPQRPIDLMENRGSRRHGRTYRSVRRACNPSIAVMESMSMILPVKTISRHSSISTNTRLSLGTVSVTSQVLETYRYV
jgi:hypothetical protein